MLWIALHFPCLPLESLLRGHDSQRWHDESWALTENGSVSACNAVAQALGVCSGMPLSTAWAMAPRLRTLPRRRRAEQEALAGLAAWLCRFTPRVSLEASQQLVAEMGGSLRLFGGLRKLEDELRAGLEDLGFTAWLAWAPTPRAALWRAAGGGAAFEDLPVEVAGIDPEVLHLLRTLGINTLGELLCMPRDGAARRFGPRLIDDLDRACGKLPEPRAMFVPPARFTARLELPAQATDAAGVLFAACRLLVQLEGVLAARQSGVRRFTLLLMHEGARPTQLEVRLSGPSRDATHFTTLLRERLARLELAAAVRALRLEAQGFEPLRAVTADLFREARDAGEERGRLFERLAARLGETAVRGLLERSEHRPERASGMLAPESAAGLRAAAQAEGHAPGARPLWLLETPRRLPENEFVLLSGPERIESGWWDGEEVRRDYFVAQTGNASMVWIYRERGGGWFLHGIFA